MKWIDNKYLNAIVTVILLVASGALVTSCHHKDLCYLETSTSKIRVAYDWSDASDASPAGMCVFFYSLDRDGEYHRFDFQGTKGGEVELPVGNYLLITYNNDTEAVQFSSTDKFDLHKAFTRTGDILEPLYGNGVTSSIEKPEGERVVITPDGLWGCEATDVVINAPGAACDCTRGDGESRASYSVDEDGTQVITLRPYDKLCHYSYEVRNVKNIRDINMISGALSGMAPSMNLSTDALDTETTTLPVSTSVDVAADKLTGEFLTFGHNTSGSPRHKMSFYVVMKDGSKYTVKDAPNLDVTSQVDDAPDPKHVHIIIDGLDLPSSPTDGNGFTSSVDDWMVKNEDLEM